jgi:hypothetical protein
MVQVALQLTENHIKNIQNSTVEMKELKARSIHVTFFKLIAPTSITIRSTVLLLPERRLNFPFLFT